MEAKEITLEMIAELQKQYGLTDLQSKINTGDAWRLEGSYGRAAMSALEDGACLLPEEEHQDYYGNAVPSRTQVKMGTNGSIENCQEFWAKVMNGEIELPEPEEPEEE
jgi:hypothetical protein